MKAIKLRAVKPNNKLLDGLQLWFLLHAYLEDYKRFCLALCRIDRKRRMLHLQWLQ
jgi:hypothetical protein